MGDPKILRGVLAGAVFAFFAAVTGVKLIRAIKLLAAVKRGKTVKCNAEITGINLPGKVRRSAEARYTLDGHEYTGQMVCAVNVKLSIGQTVSVIVSRNDPEVFALYEKQPRSAVVMYGVTAALMCAVLGVFVWALIISK